MKIGLIGAGKIGGNLTRLFTAAGHDVRVSNSRDPGTLADLATETGATAVWAKDAAEDADVVVVTIPEKAVPDLAPGILSAARPDAAVIDTCNYYPQQRDGLIRAIEDGQTESAWVGEQVDHPVFKIFNGIHFPDLISDATPSGTPGRRALPVAGDDPDGKAKVMALLDQIGFDPVDAGTIAESWRQQPGTPVYGAKTDADGIRKLLAEASPERPADFKA
jgi:predicted dinucleotide-binding enzyme